MGSRVWPGGGFESVGSWEESNPDLPMGPGLRRTLEVSSQEAKQLFQSGMGLILGLEGGFLVPQ